MKKNKSGFKKLFTKAVITEKDVENGTFTAVASTGRVDRQGEIVSPEGWDLEQFKKNPVLLWSHDHTKPAIGKATKIWIEGIGSQAKLMFQGFWQTVTKEGQEAAELVALGILNSFSVGFLPEDMVGNKYTKQELLEISLVNVPANPEAIMLAYKALKENGMSDDTAKLITRKFADLGVIRKDLFSKERGALQDELDEEAMFDAKEKNMHPVWDVFWAFCDVYYSTETPVDDFKPLIAELIVLLSKIGDGTYQGGDASEAEEENDPVESSAAGKVIDKKPDSGKTVGNQAKAPEPAAPAQPYREQLRTQQSVVKAIARASDKLIVAEKKGASKSERIELSKIIKRGAEILSKSNKGNLRNG